jgi:hypothetical protein
MAEGVRGDPGGIAGLLAELDEHGEAVEHDLVCAGWTLDDVPERLNWRAFRSFVMQDAQQPGSALRRTLIGDDHIWGLPEQLLAAVVDAIQQGNWQRAASGAKRPPKRPKPIPRPGVGKKRGRKAGGTTAVPLSEAQAIFARHNPAVFAEQAPDPDEEVDDGS